MPTHTDVNLQQAPNSASFRYGRDYLSLFHASRCCFLLSLSLLLLLQVLLTLAGAKPVFFLFQIGAIGRKEEKNAGTVRPVSHFQ